MVYGYLLSSLRRLPDSWPASWEIVWTSSIVRYLHGNFRARWGHSQMKSISKLAVGALLASVLLPGAAVGFAQDKTQQAPPADNTQANQRQSGPTADQQNNSQSDRELTQHVRQAIIGDKSMSTYAHNVKVISQNGQVTLKGPVRTEEEKQAIEAKATEVAGQGKVVNELTIAPSSK